MRSFWDRLRHTLLFNGIGLLVATPVAAWVMGTSMLQMGLLGIILTGYALLWTPLYNLLFDRYEAQRGGDPNRRSVALRALHAVGFEVGFLVPALPLIAWWLVISLWAALLLDIGFALFFLFYTFVFNWAYDQLFPVPEAAV